VTASDTLLHRCLAGERIDDALLRDALGEDAGRPFFQVVVESLADRFEKRLCDTYADLIARALEFHGGTRAAASLERYRQVRSIRRCAANPATVYVLSRITIGADVAVTSVLMNAAKRSFPEADIVFAGPRKNWELFSADPRIRLHEIAYPRSGPFLERLQTSPWFDNPRCIVIDPDSRLSQLGMVPVCPDEQYFFFESRCFEQHSSDSLPVLAARWAELTFGVDHAQAFFHTASEPAGVCDVAVSLGVGDNPRKRIGGDFEERILRLLRERGLTVLLDKGGGGEERTRVEQLLERVPGVASHDGAYAPFAASVARAQLYIGYDSAGQHVASAAGTPFLSIFAGYPSERFLARWSPPGGTVLPARQLSPEAVLQRVQSEADVVVARLDHRAQ
jgi:hypothetical protein